MIPSIAKISFFMGQVNGASTMRDGTAFWHRLQRETRQWPWSVLGPQLRVRRAV